MTSNSTTSTTEAMVDLMRIQIQSLPPHLTHQSIIPSLHLDSSSPTPINNTSDHAQVSANDVIATPGNDVIAAPANDVIAAPEKELIICAFKLAVLEKVASWLGVVGFLVATVVLLGGLVTLLEIKDFVLIGLMLVIEGIRVIFCMHYTQQLMMPIICFINRWFQLFSAIIIGALSAMQLASQDFGKNIEEAHNTIRDISLNIFYAVVLVEAHVLLAKKAFFEWKVSYCKLLKKVTNECGLNLSDMISIEKFFNDAYYKSVTGNIFYALKMDRIIFAEELVSSSGEEQLTGARILEALSIHEHLSDAALCKIGASTAVIKRLIQMRTCNNIFEENIRNSANVILRKLAHKEPKVLGVAGMEEAMRSASTLLNSYHLD